MLDKIDFHTDVLVVGGGMAGTMAALAAARMGARVILVERHTAVGGMATMGLVQPITMWGNREHYVGGGLGRRILEELAEHKGAGDMNTYGPVCDSEALKFELEKRLLADNVEILYQAWVNGVETDNGEIRAVTAVAKEGTLRFKPKMVVDASGDADVAALAGVPWDEGRQGATLMMTMAGIDWQRVPENANDIFRSHNDATYRGLLSFRHPTRRDAAFFNCTEVDQLAALDTRELTRAIVECRRQAWRILEICRLHVPGFEQAYIEQTAPALGVRESRRIRGLYCLDEHDVMSGREFPDAIARCICPVDVHGDESKQGGKRYVALKKSYAIPYRTMIAKEVKNLIVTGRPISCDQAAHSSLRRMAPGCSLGEAAGIAAAMAVEAAASADARTVDVDVLRRYLLDNGAVLHPEPIAE